MENKWKLPTIESLVEGQIVKEGLAKLLDQPPPKQWVKNHPHYTKQIPGDDGQVFTVPVQYLPIEKVEYLLRTIFGKYKIEVLREGVIFNAGYCAVRVHYYHHELEEWLFYDGVGAEAIQTNNKKLTPANLETIKQGEVAKVLPMAKSMAVKDACDHFGILFGSDLNRIQFQGDNTGILNDDEKLEKLKGFYDNELLRINEDDRGNLKRIIDNKEVKSYDKAIIELTKKLPKTK